MNKKYVLSLFILLVAPTLYLYTNCGAIDKIADIWESDPLSSRHREIAIKVLNKYRSIYVALFPYFVADAGNNIFLGRAGNTNHQTDHYNQVLDCIDDALDAYNERSGSANIYYFNDDERILGIDNDDGAFAVASGNAIFIPESLYEDAIETFVEESFVVDYNSLLLFQTLVHEFNHWNGIGHARELTSTHPDFVDFQTRDRRFQLDHFYHYSDSTYYFDLGIIQTMMQMIRPFGNGFVYGGYLYKNFKCSSACKNAVVDNFSSTTATFWEGSDELDWYGISESEQSILAQNICSNVLVNSSRATDPMNVCSREEHVVSEILNSFSGLCNCGELDSVLLSEVNNLDLDNKGVTNLSKEDFMGLGENLNFSAENNLMSNLEPALFFHVPSIIEINLKSNQLSSMSVDVFNDLTNLKSLDLSYNSLAELTDSNLFQDLGQLQRLNLNNNSLTALGPNMFNKLISLERLALNGNKLNELPPDFFDVCLISPRLLNIYLHDNNFSPELITTYRAEASAKCPRVSVSF
jgi:hypothetical protein